jgi:hypothetical protein
VVRLTLCSPYSRGSAPMSIEQGVVWAPEPLDILENRSVVPHANGTSCHLVHSFEIVTTTVTLLLN